MSTSFQQINTSTYFGFSGFYLWSTAANWTDGVPVTDGDAVVSGAVAVDDIVNLTLNSLDIQDNGFVRVDTDLTVLTLNIDDTSAIDSDTLLNGASALLVIDNIVGTGAAVQAFGVNAVTKILALTDPGENYTAAEGGEIVISASPNPASVFTLWSNNATIAFENPGTVIGAELQVSAGGSIELPGDLIESVTVTANGLAVTTNIGTTNFSDVGWPGSFSLLGYINSFDPVTGLEKITFTERTAGISDDFSGSGLSDILWRNSSNGELDVWNATNLNPNSNYTFSPQELAVVPAAGWTLETVGDYNGDGKVDLLWRNNSTGEVDVWNSTSASTVGFTTSTLAEVPTVWALQQSAADFNGDGLADLVWRNTSTGELDLWSSKGNASETYTTQSLGVIPLVWSPQEFGDFNGDGRADIIWRNSSTNEVDVWSSKVGTGVAFNTQDLGVIPTVWLMQGVGDFNGNGNDGLVWRNTSNGEVDIWTFTGNSTLSVATQEVAVVPTNWNLVAVGDYNGDGKADLLWQNASNGEIDVWLSNSGAGVSFTFHELSVVPAAWHVETDWHSI